MIKQLVWRAARRVVRIVRNSVLPESPAEAWERRARTYGARAVFNLTHDEVQLAQVTEMQKREIYPHVRAALNRQERLALDFGCGPGRFTRDLAEMIGGRAIGVDTTRAFIEMAPPAPMVEYRHMAAGRIPVADGEADLVWICLVLGGLIEQHVLEASVREINRVLRSGGLLVLIENTSPAPDAAHWKFRSVADYRALFPFVPLEHKSDYFDASERISIMTGRKTTDGNTAPAPTSS